MRVLSLFDGISCGKLALERAGIPISKYVAAEIDPYAISISKRNHPDIEHVGSVVGLTFKKGEFDLILAGSPCQGFTQAGYQQGFKDSRSRLYYEFLRIKNEVCPSFWLLENVTMKPEWVQKITRDLWFKHVLINSNLVSAQNRNRLYWANWGFSQPEDKKIYLKDILDTDPKRLESNRVPLTKSRVKMWEGRAPNITHRLKSNCIVTDQDTRCSAGLIQYDDFCRYLTEVELERLQTLPDGYTDCVSRRKRWHAIGNGWTVDVIAHILRALPI